MITWSWVIAWLDTNEGKALCQGRKEKGSSVTLGAIPLPQTQKASGILEFYAVWSLTKLYFTSHSVRSWFASSILSSPTAEFQSHSLWIVLLKRSSCYFSNSQYILSPSSHIRTINADISSFLRGNFLPNWLE